jgi:ATP-dependent Lon protease
MNVPTQDIIKQRIMSLDTSTDNIKVILKHYNNMKRLDVNSTEYYKNQVFVDLCLSYPWNKHFDIQKALQYTQIPNFITQFKQKLDEEIYGMENVKEEIVNLVCKMISNPLSTRNCIALHGAAGIGKSKFISVLSQVLGIPMQVISLGGIKDSSFFLGHGYVYVESGPGKILQNVIYSQINNPIIYFDELDKVSETDNGKDIYSFLCYLTDPTQNQSFTDHYFYGMKFDLSKVLYVFTFNDINKIDKILLDRLNVVHVQTPNNNEIIHILRDYCIPEIKKNIGISIPVTVSDEQIKYIVNNVHNFDKKQSSGIREYYRLIEKVLLHVNKQILLGFYQNDVVPDELIHKVVSNVSQTDNNCFHMYI